MLKLFKAKERGAEISVLGNALIFGSLPVVVKLTEGMPPLLFAALSVSVATILMFFIMLKKGYLHELKRKKAWLHMLYVALFVTIIPYPLVYQGISLTSASNASILSQTEVFFALLFAWWVMGESVTPKKIKGALLVALGAILVVYNGSLQFNGGDLMIIVATMFYPMGNVHAKKALKIVSPATLIFVRMFLAAPFLFMFNSLIEWGNPTQVLTSIELFWPFILFNGVFIAGLSKLLWYGGLRHLELGKATILY